jgi:hypothetical protein
VLGFLYIFIWPLLLPVVCVIVLWCVRPAALKWAAAASLLMVLLSALPLIKMGRCDLCGLARASLAIYPFSAGAIVLALVLRLACGGESVGGRRRLRRFERDQHGFER